MQEAGPQPRHPTPLLPPLWGQCGFGVADVSIRPTDEDSSSELKSQFIALFPKEGAGPEPGHPEWLCKHASYLACTPCSDYPFTVQASRAPSVLELLAMRTLTIILSQPSQEQSNPCLGFDPPTGDEFPKHRSITGEGAILTSGPLGGERMDSINTQYLGPRLARIGAYASDECRHGPSPPEAV